MGQLPSTRVSCPPRGSAAFSSRRRKRAAGPIGPSSLKKSVAREGIEPPQPKAADLQTKPPHSRSASKVLGISSTERSAPDLVSAQKVQQGADPLGPNHRKRATALE